MSTKPEDQFQIGDEVIYLPDGIYAKVDGYQFLQALGSSPSLQLYSLDCGISVRKEEIKSREAYAAERFAALGFIPDDAEYYNSCEYGVPKKRDSAGFVAKAVEGWPAIIAEATKKILEQEESENKIDLGLRAELQDIIDKQNERIEVLERVVGEVLNERAQGSSQERINVEVGQGREGTITFIPERDLTDEQRTKIYKLTSLLAGFDFTTSWEVYFEGGDLYVKSLD